MQAGVSVVGQPFLRHSHDGRGTGINLQAAGIATLALHATERLYRDVTKLTSGAIRAPPKFASENYSATNTGPQRQANDGLVASRRALPHLAQSCGVRIIFQEHRTIEGGLQRRAEFVSLQRAEIRRID